MTKKLPIGIQNFEALITGNYLYVDKTRYIHKMASEGMFYFLSRPRRFGKSLLVSTLQALFEGKKELFKGLWIEQADWDWTPHPVLKIDFSEISFNTPEIFKQSLIETLHIQAKIFDVPLTSSILRNCFTDLIIGLFENFWFETATPAFLVNLIKERQYPVPVIEKLELGQQDFAIYDLDYLKLEPLLFQTGYVTIKSHEGELYQLGYPNQEVKTSFLNYLYGDAFSG